MHNSCQCYPNGWLVQRHYKYFCRHIWYWLGLRKLLRQYETCVHDIHIENMYMSWIHSCKHFLPPHTECVTNTCIHTHTKQVVLISKRWNTYHTEYTSLTYYSKFRIELLNYIYIKYAGHEKLVHRARFLCTPKVTQFSFLQAWDIYQKQKEFIWKILEKFYLCSKLVW